MVKPDVSDLVIVVGFIVAFAGCWYLAPASCAVFAGSFLVLIGLLRSRSR